MASAFAGVAGASQRAHTDRRRFHGPPSSLQAGKVIARAGYRPLEVSVLLTERLGVASQLRTPT